MLKRRLIPCLFLQNGHIVRSQGFESFKPLGNPVEQVQRLNDWGADELIYIDITRTGGHDPLRRDLRLPTRGDLLAILGDVARRSFMPLTFGGKITRLEEVDSYIAVGADKVVINSGALRDPTLITRVAEKYGAQAMVVAVDAKREGADYVIYADNGRTRVEHVLDDWVREAVERGAGEILINSIDQDGAAGGYDLELVRRVVGLVRGVPVIACGGAGVFDHFAELFRETGASAAAAGNLYNFTENAYRRAKQTLRRAGIDVR